MGEQQGGLEHPPVRAFLDNSTQKGIRQKPDGLLLTVWLRVSLITSLSSALFFSKIW